MEPQFANGITQFANSMKTTVDNNDPITMINTRGLHYRNKTRQVVTRRKTSEIWFNFARNLAVVGYYKGGDRLDKDQRAPGLYARGCEFEQIVLLNQGFCRYIYSSPASDMSFCTYPPTASMST